MQFAVYIFDTPVTLKQGQGHETYNDNVDPKQGYSHTKLVTSCFDGVWEKANVKGFLTWGNMSAISLKQVHKSKTVLYSWSTWRNQQSYKYNCKRKEEEKVKWYKWVKFYELSYDVWHLSYLLRPRKSQC